MKLPLSTRKSAIITIFLMVATIAAFSAYFLLRDESEVQKRRQTPAATALLIDDNQPPFTDDKGEPITLNDYFGKVLVVNSWASWCPHCVADFSVLETIKNDVANEDLQILAINRGENRFVAERYLATIEFPSNIRLIIDPADHFFTAAEGYTMPETIVYGRDGSIVLHQRGNIEPDALKEAITTALNN